MGTDVKDLTQTVDQLAEEIKQKHNNLIGVMFQKRGDILMEIKQARAEAMSELGEKRKDIDEALTNLNKLRADLALREDGVAAQAKANTLKAQEIEGRESQLTNNLKALADLQKQISDSRATLKLEKDQMMKEMINANRLAEEKKEQ